MMPTETIDNVVVRIKKIRHSEEFAATVIGIEVDEKHNVLNHSHYLVIKVKKYKTNCLIFYPNELWKFTGKKTIEVRRNDNYIAAEDVIYVDTAELIRESGANFVDELYKTCEYPGIGFTLATKLWETFGKSIYDILDTGQITPLLSILRKDVAKILIETWNTKGLSKQIRWLELIGIPSHVGNKLVNYYKARTIDKVKDNPYRLLPFSLNWNTVDNIAKDKFDINNNDSKRLFAAVDHAVHEGVRNSRKGHTAFTKAQITKLLSNTLDNTLIAKAFTDHSNKALIKLNNLYIPTGFYIQEKYCASRISNCFKDTNCIPFGREHEKRLSIFENTLEFPLTEKQRIAIKMCIQNRITILTGGAGCGKTTTLVGMLDLLEFSGYRVIQMALSGRAALRMSESSGKEAHTIAMFRTHNDTGNLPDNVCFIIDEASMISISDAFAILRRLPQNSKLILIGDPVQLPPIGSGLFFKPLSTLSLLNNKRIELTEVKRQSESSGIPLIANAIRHHQWPSIPGYNGPSTGVSFLHSADSNLISSTLDVYKDLYTEDEDIRVLTPIKGTNIGTISINSQIQSLLRKTDETCILWSRQFDQVVNTGFKVNDKIVFLKNDYKRGLRNGSLGQIMKCYPASKDQELLMDALFDEGLVTLRLSDIENIQLAYSLTIHKAQGSQFDRVIIPLVKSSLTDHSLIYTALTRSVQQAVFIGREDLAKKTIESPSSASHRQTGFEDLLLQYLEAI